MEFITSLWYPVDFFFAWVMKTWQKYLNFVLEPTWRRLYPTYKVLRRHCGLVVRVCRFVLLLLLFSSNYFLWLHVLHHDNTNAVLTVLEHYLLVFIRCEQITSSLHPERGKLQKQMLNLRWRKEVGSSCAGQLQDLMFWNKSSDVSYLWAVITNDGMCRS